MVSNSTIDIHATAGFAVGVVPQPKRIVSSIALLLVAEEDAVGSGRSKTATPSMIMASMVTSARKRPE
jgi:hypothetical protein